MTAREQIESWLDAEMDRMWLIAERRLRRMQAAGIDFTGIPGLRAIEAILAIRRTQRGGETASLAEVDRALTERRSRVAAQRARAPIGRLAERLELSPLEVDVLIAALAPLVDPPLGELFQIVRGAPRRGLDLALLGELFELDRRGRLQLLQAIDADRPLARWSLVAIDGARDAPITHRTVQIAPDVVATLSGVRQLPPGLVPHAQLRRVEPRLDDLVLAADVHARVAALCTGFATAEGGLPWVVLWGPNGSGRRELATRIAAAAGRTTLVFDPTTCTADDLALRLHQAQREALIRGAALAIAPIAEELAPAIAHQLRRYPDLVFLGVTSLRPPALGTQRAVHEIALGTLPRDLAAALWRRSLPGVDTTTIVDGFQLTPGDILAAAAVATASARANGRAVGYGDARLAVELRLRAALSGLVERVDAVHTWDELVLPADDLERLREFIGRKRHAAIVYERWRLADRIRYGKGMIGLFSGPPGTGKTMIAGVIANELGMELYRVDLSQVVSKWAGETEKQLARIFDIAERTQAVLLFDEADALFGKRSSDSDGDRHQFANLTVNYLLQRLERYPGIALLTTNKEEALDEALQRRLGLHLRLELPEPAERARLWRAFLPPELPGADTVDIAWLAEQFELAGGSIKNAAVRAAFLAAGDGEALDLATVVVAVERELGDMGRVVWHQPREAMRRVA